MPNNIDPTDTTPDFTYDNPAPIVEPEVLPAAQPANEDDELFSSEDTGGFVAPDPNAVIILRFSSGDTKYVPASEPMTISATMSRAQVAAISGAVTYYLNGAEVTAETIVPLGQTVTVIGSVKGGVA